MFRASSERAPERVSRIEVLALGLLVAGLSIFYYVYANRIGNFQDDEEAYLQLARYISGHFPGALWQSGLYTRGTQRLDVVILAIPFALMRGPGAYQVAHFLQCLLFVSTAVPVFLLARSAGLPRAARLLAAALTVVVPWAVVATSFLSESPAYPAYAWVLYAIWALIRAPSLRRQVLVLVALVVAALARTALLALVPMVPIAVLWQEWRWELAGEPLSRRVRELPARLWSRYRLLTVLVAAAILALVANHFGAFPGRGVDSLAGGYGVPHVPAFSELSERDRQYVSRMAVGTGFLALALALPWTLWVLVRRPDGNRHATAVVCTLGLLAVLVSILQAGPDERYVMYGAVPIVLAATSALSDVARAFAPKRAAAVGMILGTVAVLALIGSTTWPALANPYDFFTYPAGMFYQRSLLIRTSQWHLPLIHPTPEHIVAAGILLIAVAWAIAVARGGRAARAAAVLLGAFLLGLSTIMMLYGIRKYAEGAGAESGPNAAERSWVDRHVPGGAEVAALAVSFGASSLYVPLWRATEFWNTSVDVDASFGSPGSLPFPLGSRALSLTYQPGSGLVQGYAEPQLMKRAKIPPWFLIPQQGTNELGLDGRVVAVDPYLPLELLRLNTPVRVLWTTSGTSFEGFMTPGAPVSATVFSGALAGPGPHCAAFSLIAPAGFRGSWPYTVRGGGRVLARGSLHATQTAAIDVPLTTQATPTGADATLTVLVGGKTVMVAGQAVGVKLSFFETKPCPSSVPARRSTQPSPPGGSSRASS